MNQKERKFQEFLLEWYRCSGRHDLPWRQTHDPYLILVSELMLQQTQVARVIPKYEAFVRRFSNATQLASAPLGDVLRMWQGLGYNRRAKFLHECAQVIAGEYAGQFPRDVTQLQKLPGIGPYTAAAVCAFAYNQPVLLVETNVRQVIIHHFFKNKESVTDANILHKVERVLPKENARDLYAAMMDYGTHLKALYGNNTRIVQGYTKQSKFKGSDREVRGAILRQLSVSRGARSLGQLTADLAPLPPQKIATQLKNLHQENLVEECEDGWRLP